MMDGTACRMEGMRQDIEFWMRKVPKVVQAAICNERGRGV